MSTFKSTRNYRKIKKMLRSVKCACTVKQIYTCGDWSDRFTQRAIAKLYLWIERSPSNYTNIYCKSIFLSSDSGWASLKVIIVQTVLITSDFFRLCDIKVLFAVDKNELPKGKLCGMENFLIPGYTHLPGLHVRFDRVSHLVSYFRFLYDVMMTIPANQSSS